MGAVYSVCGSGIMTLAGDVLPKNKITEGISRFAFTVSIGMAVGPFKQQGFVCFNFWNNSCSFNFCFIQQDKIPENQEKKVFNQGNYL